MSSSLSSPTCTRAAVHDGAGGWHADAEKLASTLEERERRRAVVVPALGLGFGHHNLPVG